jgi:hypothetical protein
VEIGGPAAAVIMALLCGGAAWLLFTIIPDTWRPARLGVTIVAALMGAANGFNHFGGDESALERVERELIESDEVGGLASAFKRSDPAGFDQYVREIHAAMQRDGDREAALRRVGATLNDAVAARLHRLPDAGIAAYYAIVRDELLELRAIDASACAPLVRGEPLRHPNSD